MTNAEIASAPRWRIVLAGLTDAAIAGSVAWSLRTRVSSGRVGRTGFALMAPTGDFVREQLASPGQRLLGVRTVDRRTGRRVELWRTLVLLGVGAGGQLAARRLTPPAVTADHERQRAEIAAGLQDIQQRHPEDSAAREAAQAELFASYPNPIVVNLGRAMAPSLAANLINKRLRRRLAPTTEIVVRRR